jgi:hypothetical protein
MKLRALMACTMLAVAPITSVVAAGEIPNPLIDYGLFASNVSAVGALRAQRRIAEPDFIRMARDSSTIVLDARSAEKFALLHVKGAKNLSLPDITAEELAKIIPSKRTRILIYCNNNFSDAKQAFPTKRPSASLNLSTYAALYDYGYRNVYELAPLLETTTLPMEGTLASR